MNNGDKNCQMANPCNSLPLHFEAIFVTMERRTTEGECLMGKSITDKNDQLSYLKERLTMFVEVLDHIEPESTELEDIDRLIGMLDDLEDKVQQFKTRSEE